MSDSVIFDTNLHIKRITKTGVSRETAEAIVQTVADVFEHNLATKTDIANVQQDIEILRKDTTALVLEAKNELIKEINNSQFKIVGLLAGFASLLFALNKLF